MHILCSKVVINQWLKQSAYNVYAPAQHIIIRSSASELTWGELLSYVADRTPTQATGFAGATTSV
jgi:hypothetical protein